MRWNQWRSVWSDNDGQAIELAIISVQNQRAQDGEQDVHMTTLHQDNLNSLKKYMKLKFENMFGGTKEDLAVMANSTMSEQQLQLIDSADTIWLETCKQQESHNS